MSPGRLFVQKAFLVGLFFGELIFGRTCKLLLQPCLLLEGIFHFKWVGVESLKQLSINSLWALHLEGLSLVGFLRM